MERARSLPAAVPRHHDLRANRPERPGVRDDDRRPARPEDDLLGQVLRRHGIVGIRLAEDREVGVPRVDARHVAHVAFDDAPLRRHAAARGPQPLVPHRLRARRVLAADPGQHVDHLGRELRQDGWPQVRRLAHAETGQVRAERGRQLHGEVDALGAARRLVHDHEQILECHRLSPERARRIAYRRSAIGHCHVVCAAVRA